MIQSLRKDRHEQISSLQKRTQKIKKDVNGGYLKQGRRGRAKKAKTEWCSLPISVCLSVTLRWAAFPPPLLYARAAETETAFLNGKLETPEAVKAKAAVLEIFYIYILFEFLREEGIRVG